MKNRAKMGRPRVMQIQHLVTILNSLPSLTRSFRLIHWNAQRTLERTPGNLLMPLPSLEVLKGSECSHLFTTSKCVRVRIPRMMFFKFQRHSLISVSQCLASSQLIGATLNTATAVRTSCMGTCIVPTLRVTR